MKLVEVPASERKVLTPLFSSIEYLRGMIESVLNGDFGSAVVDDLEKPEVVQLSVGQNVFLVGNPQSVSARFLVEQLPGSRLLVINEEWQRFGPVRLDNYLLVNKLLSVALVCAIYIPL